MASQTRLDGPQTHLCRRQCGVHFRLESIQSLKRCVVTHVVTPMIVSELVIVMRTLGMLLGIVPNGGLVL